MRLLERLAIGVASLALSVGLIALLSGFFAARDKPGVASAAAPGVPFRDQGNALLAPGQPHPAYDSSPPTSGPHLPAAVTRDQTRLSTDQLLQALSLGDVVLVYGRPRPPAGLVALARSLSGPFSTALAASGQAVVLDSIPGTVGYTALAWAHMTRVLSPADPQLRAFALYWLGRGAGSR